MRLPDLAEAPAWLLMSAPAKTKLFATLSPSGGVLAERVLFSQEPLNWHVLIRPIGKSPSDRDRQDALRQLIASYVYWISGAHGGLDQDRRAHRDLKSARSYYPRSFEPRQPPWPDQLWRPIAFGRSPSHLIQTTSNTLRGYLSRSQDEPRSRLYRGRGGPALAGSTIRLIRSPEPTAHGNAIGALY